MAEYNRTKRMKITKLQCLERVDCQDDRVVVVVFLNLRGCQSGSAAGRETPERHFVRRYLRSSTGNMMARTLVLLLCFIHVVASMVRGLLDRNDPREILYTVT